MKTILLGGLLAGQSLCLFAQTDKNLVKEKWKPGTQNIIFGHAVTRVQGKNDKKGITNVAYQGHEGFVADLKKYGEKVKWTEEQTKTEIEQRTKNSEGGLIHLYLTRISFKSANTEHFHILLKDSAGNVILEKGLENDIPEAPASGSDYWSNHITIPIQDKGHGKLHVYVKEKEEAKTDEYIFEVSR